MKHFFTLLLLTGFSFAGVCQTLYFPPLTGSTWETTDPATLGWCPEKIGVLLDYLGQNDTKAFIVLKNGKIVIEKYYGAFTRDSVWYWASAGKTITSMLVGIARENGQLDINRPSSDYMGTGWTSLPPQQEAQITVRHQLTMTTGLDDGVPDMDCTLPGCLTYKAAPGTRWAYHNAPYTLLDSVIRSATGLSLNAYTTQKIKSKTGMTGLWIKSGYNNVYVSTARSMARYGLLVLNRGVWDTQAVLGDTAYFGQMTRTSQNINLSYGYLWWLAGKSSFMLPQSQFVFNGSAVPNAPDDMVAALGKNGQIINVVPSRGLVLVRMGNAPGSGSSLVSNVFDNEIWAKMNDLSCTSAVPEYGTQTTVKVFPNPVRDVLYLSADNQAVYDRITVYDHTGREINTGSHQNTLDASALPAGLYFLRMETQGKVFGSSFVKQ